MKKVALLLNFCLFATLSCGQIKENQAIDDLFVEWDKPNTPGCALGIMQNGQLIYAKGYGLANLEYDIPNSPNSVFRIASTSKQFTAACIVKLVEQGKLSLDNTLKQHFPDFPDYANQITIKHLLNHTSGIRDYLTISYLKGLSDNDFYTDKDVMKWLVNQQSLNFKPGDEYLYSNSGFWLLGQIVNKVAGMNMADFAEKEIFKPLGMTSTHFHHDHTAIVKNRASGYMPTGDDIYQISMTTLDMIGDGGVFTTIEDIKKWDDAYYDSKVLSKEFWEMMTKQGVLNNGEVIEYALGLEIGEYNGLKTIRHGGAFVGFRTELLRFPAQHLSIAIFANRADANPSAKANQIADILLKDQLKSPEVDKKDKKENKKQSFIQLKTQELENFSGYYWNEARSYSRKIYVNDDTLRYYRSENSESDLLPIGNNEFKMINVGADVLVKFDNNEQGNHTLSFIVNGGEPITSKEYQPKDYSKVELRDLEGTYYSKEMDVDYVLKLEENALMLYLNGSEISPLKPIMENLFTNDDYGTFQFEAVQGKVSAFKLAAGRVKNLIFVRQ